MQGQLFELYTSRPGGLIPLRHTVHTSRCEGAVLMIVLVMPHRDHVPLFGKRSNWVGNVIGRDVLAYEVELHCIEDLEAIWRVSGRPRRPVSHHARNQCIAPRRKQCGSAAGLPRLADDADSGHALSPMAAAFFQGAVGKFMAYNAFGQGQAVQPTGSGYAPIPSQPALGQADTRATVQAGIPNGTHRSLG